MALDTLGTYPSVTLALIVRDEENTLPRCLNSIRGAVDEIVVVDTGSQDATRSIAQRYTKRVFDFDWRQDFSAARQFAFDQASGDWVGWLDADDVVRGAQHIRRLASEAPADTGAIYWPYVVAWDDYGHPTCQYWRERLVRNDGSYCWQGRVHEVLTSPPALRSGFADNQAGQSAYSDAVIVEHRPLDRDATTGSNGRNLAILEAEYAACQADPPARLLFYLAREYAERGRDGRQQALEIYARHLERCNWDDERYQSLLDVAAIHVLQEESERAIDTLLQALKVCPHWPEAYFALARAYYYSQDWPRVIHWTEMGRAMPPPQRLLFTNPMDYRFNWMIYYTNALYHLGELQEALQWTRQALAICPGDAMHRQNLAFFKQAAEKTDGSNGDK